GGDGHPLQRAGGQVRAARRRDAPPPPPARRRPPRHRRVPGRGPRTAPVRRPGHLERRLLPRLLQGAAADRAAGLSTPPFSVTKPGVVHVGSLPPPRRPARSPRHPAAAAL